MPSSLFGCSGIFAVNSGAPDIFIFSGCSTKKYLGASSKSFLFTTYNASTGIVAFDFFIPKLSMKSLIAFGWMPRSFRDCSDHVRGSFQPINVPSLTSLAPFDFDIFTPSIMKCPL